MINGLKLSAFKFTNQPGASTMCLLRNNFVLLSKGSKHAVHQKFFQAR